MLQVLMSGSYNEVICVINPNETNTVFFDVVGWIFCAVISWAHFVLSITGKECCAVKVNCALCCAVGFLLCCAVLRAALLRVSNSAVCCFLLCSAVLCSALLCCGFAERRVKYSITGTLLSFAVFKYSSSFSISILVFHLGEYCVTVDPVVQHPSDSANCSALFCSALD